MSMWRPLFLKCMILDHKLQRMLNDSKIAQLNSERPLHQTAVSGINVLFGVHFTGLNNVSVYQNEYTVCMYVCTSTTKDRILLLLALAHSKIPVQMF